MVKLGPLGAVVSRSSSLASWVRPSRKRRESGGRRAAWRRAHDLGVAGGVEPAVVAVEDEDFAGRLVVTPAHEAGLPEQEGAGFGAVEAHAGVVLGVAGAEGAEVVVVVVNPADEDGVGLCVEERGAEQREQQGLRAKCGDSPLHQNDSKCGQRQRQKQIPPLRCGMTTKVAAE